MKALVFLGAVALACGGLASPATAQSGLEAVKACTAIKSSSARLACFDVAARQLEVAAPAQASQSSTSLSPAFGIEMGQAVAEYGGAEIAEKTYLLDSVPQPNAEFASYHAIATEAEGICLVNGFSNEISNDADGVKTRAYFAEMEDRLSEQYGTVQHLDRLKPEADAKFKQARNWVASLKGSNRVYASTWESGEVTAAGLEQVGLYAIYRNDTTALVFVRYQFPNYDACS